MINLSELISAFVDKKPFGFELKNTEEFWNSSKENNVYVEPDFSMIHETSNCASLKDAQVIFISAVGASGKSELTKRLSFTLKTPVVDLGSTKVVGGNSLTGLIFKYLQPIDGGNWLADIKNGNSCMIIDALDEGYQKTNTQGFFDFLDDTICKIADKGPSFAMLGRTNAIELASLYLDEKGVKFVTLQIEPFSLEKAKEFIDKHVFNSLSIQHKLAYCDTRDYVLESLGNFFKENDSKDEGQSQTFIGYAPVLLAISEFLNSKTSGNYKTLLEDLKRNEMKSVSLILDIAKRILERDKNNKVVPNLIKPIIINRNEEFQKQALREAYTAEEQCARVLYILLGEDFPFKPVNDEAFDVEYRKGLDSWMLEHPFLKERKPANVVFECYMLVSLIKNEKYKDAVYRYLTEKRVNSFMFFHLFNELNQSDFVDANLISYLYNSLKTLDSKKHSYSLEIEPTDDNTEPLSYDVTFVSSDNSLPDYNFKTKLPEKFIWHGPISDATIDILKDFVINSRRTDLFAPSYIHCRNFIVSSEEINYSCRELSSSIVVEADSIVTETPSRAIPKILSIGNSSGTFTIISSAILTYPFCDYQKKKSDKELKMSETMKDIYQKVRRTIIMFRSHSKGQLAKHHAKIDNRIGNTQIGKAVVAALLDKHIMYRKDHVYIIDNYSMDKYLGVKFDGIRNSTITDTMMSFLNDIEKTLPRH